MLSCYLTTLSTLMDVLNVRSAMTRPPKMLSVAPRLKLIDARNMRRLSQQQVAERLGTTYVTVSRWERGVSDPYPHYRRKLCQLFGETEEELDLVPTSVRKASIPSFGESALSKIAALPQPVYDPAMPLPSLLLVGRDRELVELKRNLRNGGSGSVIALSGLPGVGKTDLARNVVYDPQIRSHFS